MACSHNELSSTSWRPAIWAWIQALTITNLMYSRVPSCMYHRTQQHYRVLGITFGALTRTSTGYVLLLYPLGRRGGGCDCGQPKKRSRGFMPRSGSDVELGEQCYYLSFIYDAVEKSGTVILWSLLLNSTQVPGNITERILFGASSIWLTSFKAIE